MKVFGVTGWKNSGKTTLVEKLVAEIVRRGLTVSTVKHAHHSFDIDQPGKDSHRHRLAGASEVILSSSQRWALMHELRGQLEPELDEMLRHLAPVDLVLVEGFKSHPHPKIEVRNDAEPANLIADIHPEVVAIASEGDLEHSRLPGFDRNDITAIADFILAQTGLPIR